jgi:hypothetical protein
MLPLCACAVQPADPPSAPMTPALQLDPETVVIQPPAGTPRPPVQFSPADERLLDEIEHATFDYFWRTALPRTGMVPDRTSGTIVSVAGVGFQLSALPIGVERGWITLEEGRQRAETILSALSSNPQNRHAGLFFHYLSPDDAGPSVTGYELTVSTIDSALLFAGIMTASSYFGADTARAGDALLANADWRAFLGGQEGQPHERGFISLGWKPRNRNRPTGDGSLLPFYWIDSGDEHRLVTFLAVGAPEPRGVEPALYYRLRRALGRDAGEPLVFFPWSGALFTAFFAHCWIDYAHLGPDHPADLGIPRRARVDWWENSRRTVALHRARAIQNPAGLPTFGEHAWGLSASDSRSGYAVPGLFPQPIEMRGALPDVDFAPVTPRDNYGDGTIAPYAAGSSIMFDPVAAVAALRYYRTLKNPEGGELVWRTPAAGGWGFQDAFCLSQPPWVAPDCVAIDQGPLLLAIENARTGLIWALFSSHPVAKAATQRLRLTRVGGPTWPRPATEP